MCLSRNKYCQVCKHYINAESCKLGYKEFCNQEKFEPSVFDSIINFLYEAYLADLNIPDVVYDELESFAKKRFL